MSTALQFRRGTTAQHASFTGAVGELTVDTDKDTVVVHDGATAGGFPGGGFLQAGTGATRRSAESKLRDFVSVKDFGAAGDGSDQTAALAAAVAYVNSVTLTSRPVGLYFPKGVYVSSASLTFNRPVYVFAYGDAVLNFTGGATSAIQLGPNSITGFDVFLQGEYTIDGLRLTGGANAIYGIYINDFVIEPRIRNVVFEDYGNASSYDIFSQFEVWDIIIENCRKFTVNSTTATGHFICITGRNKAGTAYDGGNSRATIQNCWMTSYNNVALGFFASVNAVKCRIIGGGFQHSAGGIQLGGFATGTLIDGVYCELSTPANPFYITTYSIAQGDGTYWNPEQVVVRNGYINFHQEVIGSAGKFIKAGDANAKMISWDVSNVTFSNYASGQNMVDQNNISGQRNNRYQRCLQYIGNTGAVVGFNWRGGGYTNAEEWCSADDSQGAWTPVDGSGAGLTFAAGTTGVYTRVGNIVFVSGSVRYPSTANANGAVIGGLPFAMASSPDGAQGGLTINYSPSSTPLVFKPNNGSTELIVRAQAGGAQQTNAQLSGGRFDFSGFYRVA